MDPRENIIPPHPSIRVLKGKLLTVYTSVKSIKVVKANKTKQNFPT
jgi:hypothetical protein